MEFESTSEIHRLLKLGDSSPIILGIPDLPIKQEKIEDDTATLQDTFKESIENLGQKSTKFKGLLIYPVIFVVAFGFFFMALNFSSVWAQIQGFFIQPQAKVVLGDELAPYYQWINGYFYAVNDAKLLDTNNDIDKDGLSNYDEFVMRTNPTVSDSDSDGYSDGTEVINSYNPWGVGPITTAQKDLASKIDNNLINNRISYNATLHDAGIVSGEQKINYDLTKPGVISIPKLNLQVPLVWSKDPADFETDLTKGVIHYPGTSLPGEKGTVYVSGHSSDYIWKKNPFQSVFAKLNYLKPGDDVFVDIYGVDGKTYNYRYQVTGSAIFKPDDQMQFIDNSVNKLNLSTCWPIGTATNRIVVSAIQVGL